MYRASCHALNDCTPLSADQMFRLRYRVFHERLAWDVRCVAGYEIDTFDDFSARYVLVRDVAGNRLRGSWRLRPTTAPYMLKDIFPQLLCGRRPPQSPDIWEISRLAVEQDALDGIPTALNEIVLELIRATDKFAADNVISQFVTVTTPALERLLINAGLNVKRLGHPQIIGRVSSVACRIDIDNSTRNFLRNDETVEELRAAA